MAQLACAMWLVQGVAHGSFSFHLAVLPPLNSFSPMVKMLALQFSFLFCFLIVEKDNFLLMGFRLVVLVSSSGR